MPPQARIRKRREFEEIQSKAKRLHARHFILLLAPAKTSQSRLGLIITLKVEKSSVKRNKLRRRLREIFRTNRHKLTKPNELVIIARRGAMLLSLEQIRTELLTTLHRHGYVDD